MSTANQNSIDRLLSKLKQWGANNERTLGSSQGKGDLKPSNSSRKASAKILLLFAAYAVLCMAFAKLVLFGLGDPHGTKPTIALGLLLIFLVSSKKAYFIAVLPLSILAMLYT